MEYDQLKDQMQTGDIILFSGQYKISKMIEFLSGSKFSHVGMVVRLEGYNEPLLLESTTLTNLKDVLSNDTIEGPKLVDLHQRLQDYGKEVVPYHPPTFAYHPLEDIERNHFDQVVLDLHKKYHGRKECSDSLMVWDVFKGRYFHQEADKDKFFCSELIALAYMALGLIDHRHPYNAYMPKDFDQGHHFLKLQKGHFGKQTNIDI